MHLFVQVILFKYGIGDKNPLQLIPIYKKSFFGGLEEVRFLSDEEVRFTK